MIPRDDNHTTRAPLEMQGRPFLLRSACKSVEWRRFPWSASSSGSSTKTGTPAAHGHQLGRSEPESSRSDRVRVVLPQLHNEGRGQAEQAAEAGAALPLMYWEVVAGNMPEVVRIRLAPLAPHWLRISPATNTSVLDHSLGHSRRKDHPSHGSRPPFWQAVLSALSRDVPLLTHEIAVAWLIDCVQPDQG